MKRIFRFFMLLLVGLLAAEAVFAQRSGPPVLKPPGGGSDRCILEPFGVTTGPPDPGAPGLFDVGITEYMLSLTGFHPQAFDGLVAVEELAAVFYPRPLACGPFPVILLMHGSHATCYSFSEKFFDFSN